MSLKSYVRRTYRRFPIVKELWAIREELVKLRQANLVLLESHMLQDARSSDPKRLLRYGAQSFSQNREDGQIAEIFRRIGETSRQFVEIGCGDGLQNNTALLLARGWRGTWIESNRTAEGRIRVAFREQLSNGQLTFIRDMVTIENVANRLARANVPSEFDLLSIDVDRNTYHIWAALNHIWPRVAVVEYNSYFPPTVDWKVVYEPNGIWAGGIYFGASLKALELLGRELGYSLVGCDVTGTNAFFVRNDLVGHHFAAPFTSENHFEPLRYGLIGRTGPPVYFEDLVRELHVG